jgi:hypothetical protein
MPKEKYVEEGRSSNKYKFRIKEDKGPNLY